MIARNHINTFLTAALLASAAPVVPAHAGLSDMINDFFTFREDQKERVRPKRRVVTKEVTVPHYDERQATDWAYHYTRDDLEPVEYMDGSASMVMRRRGDARRLTSENGATGVYLGEPGEQPRRYHQGYPPGYGPQNPPPGYMAILWRDYMNRQQQQNRRIHVGQAGSRPGQPIDTGMDIGQKTKVGEPVRAWNDPAPQQAGIAPRKGDFDYNSHIKELQSARTRTQDRMRVSGMEVARAPGEAPLSNQEINRIDQMNAQQRQQYQARQQQAQQDLSQYPSLATPPEGGQQAQPRGQQGVTQQQLRNRYRVEQGDTLSGISEKPVIYGDWTLWPLIYDANRNQIKDPDLIYPEQEFDIPRDYDQPAENNARTRAYEKKPPYDFYDGR